MISTDRSLLEEGSAAWKRHVQYAALFTELHIIVFTTRATPAMHPSAQPVSFRLLDSVHLAANGWVYPTGSLSRLWYLRDGVRIGVTLFTRDTSARTTGSLSPEGKRDRNGWVVSAENPFEAGLTAYRIARQTGMKLYLQIHTDFLSPYFARLSLSNRLRVALAKRLLPHADGIRVVSPRIRQSLTAYLSPLAHPVVLPIFTDLERLRSAPPTVYLRTKYPQWNFIILMVARLRREKNIPLALRVLKTVVDRYATVGLVVVGEGSEKARLKRLAKRLGLQDHLAFEGEQRELVPYYRSAHLFLQTSWYEGYGRALVEAIAAKLPAVSTDVGIAGELLCVGGDSFICPVGDAACLAAKVVRFIEDNKLREQFRRTAPLNLGKVCPSSPVEYLARYRELFRTAAR